MRIHNEDLRRNVQNPGAVANFEKTNQSCDNNSTKVQGNEQVRQQHKILVEQIQNQDEIRLVMEGLIVNRKERDTELRERDYQRNQANSNSGQGME